MRSVIAFSGSGFLILIVETDKSSDKRSPRELSTGEWSEDFLSNLDQVIVKNNNLETVSKQLFMMFGPASMGASIGAILGTFVFPGMGTLMGAAIGAGIGFVSSMILMIKQYFDEKSESSDEWTAGLQAAPLAPPRLPKNFFSCFWPCGGNDIDNISPAPRL